jgi:hypothetical protein
VKLMLICRTNDYHHRASASEVSKVKNAPPDASVHGSVRRRFSRLATIGIERKPVEDCNVQQ